MPSACPGFTTSLLVIPSVHGPSSSSALHAGGLALSSSIPHTHTHTYTLVQPFLPLLSSFWSLFLSSRPLITRTKDLIIPHPPRAGSLTSCSITHTHTHTPKFIVSKATALFIILPARSLLQFRLGLGSSLLSLPYNSFRVLCFITVTRHRVVQTTTACQKASRNPRRTKYSPISS